MVRLKAHCGNLRRQFSSISIPYGAIKRISLSMPNSHINLFQFLMVRLKVSRQNFLVVDIIFQFLMVRLKENSADTLLLSICKFQFLMVRLKDFC